MNVKEIEHEVENFIDQEEVISYLAHCTSQTTHGQYAVLKKQTQQGLVQAIESHVSRTRKNSYNQAQFNICNDLQIPLEQKRYTGSICDQLKNNGITEEKTFSEAQKELLFAQTIVEKYKSYLNQTITQRLNVGLTGVRQ